MDLVFQYCPFYIFIISSAVNFTKEYRSKITQIKLYHFWMSLEGKQGGRGALCQKSVSNDLKYSSFCTKLNCIVLFTLNISNGSLQSNIVTLGNTVLYLWQINDVKVQGIPIWKDILSQVNKIEYDIKGLVW